MLKRFFLLLLITAVLTSTIRTQTIDLDRAKPVVVALTERFSGLNTLTNTATDAASDRMRALIYNSLVRVNENFEYVGELGEYKIGDDNLTVTFTLRDGVKFHNGKLLTAEDVKYTFDALFAANGAKAGSFYDYAPDKAKRGAPKKTPHLRSIETPDAKTVVFRLSRLALVNELLANLVTIPIIPEGTSEQQNFAPIGTGAFRFVRFDEPESAVELEAFPEYWEGAPKIAKLNVKTVSDPSALESELLRGNVDVVFNPSIFSPGALKRLEQASNLTVERFPGSNIQYIGFNTKVAPFDNVKVRRAVAYAIDREKIIDTIFDGHAKLAHSILPEESWAYTTGTKYVYDPAKARQLLKETGYKGQVINLLCSLGNQTTVQYAQVVRNMLKAAGFNVEIEALEANIVIETLKSGRFQMNTSVWIGGNQAPIFLQDLFASENFPEKNASGRNRARYSNPEFDRIIREAAGTTDKTKAKALYARAQSIISRDVPLLPLWYPSHIVVANKRVKNIKTAPDWRFVRNLEN